jgi:chromosome segregation ATPase
MDLKSKERQKADLISDLTEKTNQIKSYNEMNMALEQNLSTKLNELTENKKQIKTLEKSIKKTEDLIKTT